MAAVQLQHSRVCRDHCFFSFSFKQLFSKLPQTQEIHHLESLCGGAVTSRRKKGSDRTRSMAVHTPRHILPSPPTSAIGSTSTVSNPPTYPSISNISSSHPSPIPPATQSPYASVSVSVQSTNPQVSPFCLDNPTSLVPMQHDTLAPCPTQNNTHPLRIVWGTQRRCTALVVHKVICALLPNHMWSSTTVKTHFIREALVLCGGILL